MLRFIRFVMYGRGKVSAIKSLDLRTAEQRQAAIAHKVWGWED